MSSEIGVSRKLARITGIVQGVGFRPFVYHVATRLGLAGSVLNSSGSVEVDVEGPPESIDALLRALTAEVPPLARIESVTTIEADPMGYTGFRILESQSQPSVDGVIPADVSTCTDCLREIDDPADRRRAYPFTNCTNCGPRFTIVQRVPYDRANTTMSAFPMCEKCAAEYADPADRRFHAEPTACPVCGPNIWLEEDGSKIESDVPKRAARLLRDGAIVAIKGLGGFHLACDAANDDAVRTLRTRKGRAAKPFALMVRDIAEAEKLCEMDGDARELIASHRRPIVLLTKRQGVGISDRVAPGNTRLGLMLPYTPLHHLLFEHSPPALVMTSANLSEEPLVFTNSSARTDLARLADAYLMHNRDIHVPCDDSVIRPIAGGLSILARRARGYVPDAIEMPVQCDCILGGGSEQKNTFCLAGGKRAVLSQHIGDLDTVETLDYYRYAISHFQALFQRQPSVIAHDLHPDYMSTQYAREQSGVRLIGVQHHHAHIASCLAEHGRTERCIGVALDGTGMGTDGTVWGGEILIADLAGYERVAHFAHVPMPGGDAAVLDPKRMAVAYLHSVYGESWQPVAQRLRIELSELEVRVISHQLKTGMNSPTTSSAGRLFDAVSYAIGACRERSYEGQPAIALEMAADEAISPLPLFRDLSAAEIPKPTSANRAQIPKLTPASESAVPRPLNTLQLFRAAVEDRLASVAPSIIAAKFHASLVNLLTSACVDVRERTLLNTVALSGGVFQNAIILMGMKRSLEQHGFEVLIHRLVPPNDACISLGQVAVAAAVLANEVT